VGERQFEVTVRGNGDPEIFVAQEVQIKCEHGQFTITFRDDAGLVINTPGYRPLAIRLSDNELNVFRGRRT
jgi:hypothetical protein